MAAVTCYSILQTIEKSKTEKLKKTNIVASETVWFSFWVLGEVVFRYQLAA